MHVSEVSRLGSPDACSFSSVKLFALKMHNVPLQIENKVLIRGPQVHHLYVTPMPRCPYITTFKVFIFILFKLISQLMKIHKYFEILGNGWVEKT